MVTSAPRKVESVSEVQAIKAEATGEDHAPIVLKYDGEEYTVPAVEDWNLTQLEEFESSHGTLLMKSLLGPVQWQKFRAKHDKPKHLDDLYDVMNEASGAGN